jgi:hypothetical protein
MSDTKELELLQSIAEKQNTSLAEVKEIKSAHEAAKKEADELKKLVDDLNKEVKAKDGTIGDILNEVKELKAKRGRFSVPQMTERKSIEVMIVEAIESKKEEIKASEKGRMIEPIEMKDAGVITDSNFTGTNAPYRSYLDWQPGMEPTGQFRFRNLVRTIQSDGDYVSFPRAKTPIGEGSFGKQAAQTDSKAQLDRDYEMIDVTLKATAGYTIVSRASLRNIRFLQSWLPTSLMEQLEDTEDTQFANALVATATGSTSVTGVTNSSDAIGKIVVYIKNLIAAKYTPGVVATDPNVWANILLHKESNAGFNLPNVVTVDAQGNTRVLGRVIQPVNWLTGNRILTGDWSKAAIVQSEGLVMRQSDSHDEIFAKNQVAFLLERTEELATFRPDAFISTVIS